MEFSYGSYKHSERYQDCPTELYFEDEHPLFCTDCWTVLVTSRVCGSNGVKGSSKENDYLIESSNWTGSPIAEYKKHPSFKKKENWMSIKLTKVYIQTWYSEFVFEVQVKASHSVSSL